MAFCSMFFCIYIISTYKIYGSSEDIDDFTLTMAGSLGAVANASSKLMCGILVDKYGFKKVYWAVLGVQVVISSTIFFIVKTNKYLYVIWVLIAHVELGSHYSLFPTLTT